MSCRHFQYLSAGYKSKSKSVLCKAPIREICHSGSAVISIVVAVATKDQGRNANLLCQWGPESLN